MPGGSFIGALISGFITDMLGRKRAIQVGAVIWCVGSIIVCASQDIAMLVVGRFINGLSVGICSAQVPVYVSELAPPSKRGRVVGAQQWAITWGILIMFYISYGCSFINGTAAFRIPWGLQMIPAICLFIGLLFLPEVWRAPNVQNSTDESSRPDGLPSMIAGKRHIMFSPWYTPNATAMLPLFSSSSARSRHPLRKNAVTQTSHT